MQNSYSGKVSRPNYHDHGNDHSSIQPNIVFILADDYGYHDIGYHGKQYGGKIQTPVMDKLAAEGVILENYYVQPICSPTRAQLMSGRYQVRSL